MRRTTRTTRPTALAAAAALALLAAPAAAGPPAVCHPIATRGEVPLSAGPDGWADVAAGLTGAEAVERALAALARSDETLLHMETLRRTVIAVTGIGPRPDPSRSERARTVRALLDGLRAAVAEARALPAEGPGERRAAARRLALARFDLGYAAAALEQAGVSTRVDYDAELAAALAACEDDGAMHLGAALGTWMETKRETHAHLDAALARAEEDELLRENLLSTAAHFLDVHTLAELRTRVAKELGRT